MPTLKYALFAGMVVGCLASQALAAGPKVYDGYKVPRDSLGRPDLNGVWNAATMTPFQRPTQFGNRLVMTEDEVKKAEGVVAAREAVAAQKSDVSLTVKELPADGSGNYNAGFLEPGSTVMRVHGEPRTSLVTTADGLIPLDFKGKRERQFAIGGDEAAPPPGTVAEDPPGRNDNPEGRSLSERCVSYASSVITPRLYNSNTLIQQGVDSVAIQAEMIHDVRIVRLNGKHRTDGIREWNGDSVGHYEGDTLVVETTGYDPRTRKFGGSDNVKVTERFTRVSPTRLHYAFTVEDPQTWAKPWGGEYELTRSPAIYDFACHEGNYGLENILAGARGEEAQQRTASAK